MKFQPDSAPGVNLISRHDADRVWVGATPFRHSIVVPWTGSVRRWDPASCDALTADHFAALLACNPELVIFGSGARLRFPPASLLRPLIEARVGVETMDTAAACRTYNVLASEGRTVVAALLLSEAATSPGTL